MPDAPNVYSIAPDVPFLDSLAAGLLERHNDDAFALSDVQVFLPTRRACRALTEAFLRQSGDKALLLPQLTPLGEAEQSDESLLSEDEPLADAALQIPPAVPDLQRQFSLSRLILEAERQRLGEAPSPANAARLAAALVSLLDQVETEQLNFEGLSELVDADYASHWQVTLDFLRIVTEQWPGVLAVLGCEDPAIRRNLLSEAQINKWQAAPPAGPVYAAGSTGSIPATAAMLEMIARLPQGAVILPGFDPTFDADGPVDLPATHPQNGMLRLIRRIGLESDEVGQWLTTVPSRCSNDRVKLIRAATAPPDAAMDSIEIDFSNALTQVSFVTCPTSQEEAGVIALALREALETTDRTAALITPDRTLARRVAAELRRWGIEIDDSAGQPLSSAPAGTYLQLLATCFADQLAPTQLLSLLKHPLAAGGMETAAFRSRVRLLERLVLRGPRPGPGFEGIATVLESLCAEGSPYRDDAQQLQDWVAGIQSKAETFEALMVSGESVPLVDLIDAHIQCAESLAATGEVSGPDRLWAGDDGEAAASFISELRESSETFPAVPGYDYPALLDVLMATRIVRPRFGPHPRLYIWGLLEARMQSADVICLGGLNETVWPREPVADPWMSRPMRDAFGLPPAERRIGLSAHDFVQAFCAEQVMVTRAERVEGTPTVPARWLLRLDNVLEGGGAAGRAARHQATDNARWLGWQATLDVPEKVQPGDAPAPKPPVSARPRQLSVTQVETWMRDPYAVYARHILRLRPLDVIDADPGAAERGTMIHDALDRFVREHPEHMPANVVQVLRDTGITAFGEALALPGVWAFWWPRFERITEWFAQMEGHYRQQVKKTHTEVIGKLKIGTGDQEFTLIAKADRVDELHDGTISIIDYKTGGPPSGTDISLGFAPQLPLEAAIAQAGGFAGTVAAQVSLLEFWRLSGGDPAGERKPAGKDIDALAQAALLGLTELVTRYDDPDTPYLSQPDPSHAPSWSDYTHLARVLEWSSIEGGGE
ncbi:MAG: double-strand break repair protein AddB [Alphaproteobacteria bacterium]|nr:double-strand break repair protein AddB [Alphaproteobacteria bacterium]